MDIIITALIGLVGVVAGAFITNYFTLPKVKAEAEKARVEAEKARVDAKKAAIDIWENLALKMEKRAEIMYDRVDKLEVIVDKQEKKINRYGKRIIYLTNGIETLLHQILKEGKEPCWNPNDWDPELED